jgi:hypothetical protein
MDNISDNDKTINIGQYRIRWLPKDKNYFLDKTTLIFGGSGSGKTTINEEILYLIKDDIPNFLFITNKSSEEIYKKKIPEICIKNDLTAEMMTNIWTRQNHMTECYKIANDMQILENLYDKIPDGYKKRVSDIDKMIKGYIEEANNSTLPFDKKKALIANITDIGNNKKKELYKSSIRNNQKYLLNSKLNLNLHEKVAIEFLDMNPRLMIVLDDVSDKFKIWMKMFKQEQNPFESIFYQGRHNFISLLFSAHDDTVVHPTLRKNARTIIYTSSNSLLTAFTRTGNGYTKEDKKMVEMIAKHFYGDETSSNKTYKKICYIREDVHPFRYTIANIDYPDFKLGEEYLYKLVENLPKNNNKLKENPLIKHLFN